MPNQVPYKPVPNEEVPNEAAEPSPLESKPAEAKPYKERRRSSVLETVEKFNKQPTAPPKKILIPGKSSVIIYSFKSPVIIYLFIRHRTFAHIHSKKRTS